MKTLICLIIFGLLMWWGISTAKDYDDSYVVWYGNGNFVVESH